MMKKEKKKMEEGEIDDVSEMREPLLEKVGQIESRSLDWTFQIRIYIYIYIYIQVFLCVCMDTS